MSKRTRALARIEKELSRLGLLLQHDTELPSVTALVALMENLAHMGAPSPIVEAVVVDEKQRGHWDR